MTKTKQLEKLVKDIQGIRNRLSMAQTELRLSCASNDILHMYAMILHSTAVLTAKAKRYSKQRGK